MLMTSFIGEHSQVVEHAKTTCRNKDQWTRYCVCAFTLSFVPKFLAWFAKSNGNKKCLYFLKSELHPFFLIKHLVVGKHCGWETTQSWTSARSTKQRHGSFWIYMLLSSTHLSRPTWFSWLCHEGSYSANDNRGHKISWLWAFPFQFILQSYVWGINRQQNSVPFKMKLFSY